MSKLSKKREDAVYRAVHDRIMDLRVEVARLTNGQEFGPKLDGMIAKAQGEAAWSAVRAAKGEPKS